MALMGAGVVAISNSEAPSPDQGYWFVLNEKAQLVEDRNLVVQFAQKSMKRSVSASSTTGSVGPAVTDTAEVQTLRMELELSRVRPAAPSPSRRDHPPGQPPPTRVRARGRCRCSSHLPRWPVR